MADVAIPIDGSERSVDVLNAARRCLVAALALACAACGESRVSGEAGGAEGGGGESAAEGALLSAIGERLDDVEARVRPAEPTWPEDLRLHPETRLESIEVMAVLEDEEGRPYSFTRRFDRVSLAGLSDAVDAASGEDFAFEQLVRLSGATRVGRAAGTVGGAGGGGAGADERTPGSPAAGTLIDAPTAIERVTLGLAEAGAHALAVRDVRLERSSPSGEGAGGASCALEQHLREGERLALRFAAAACPSGALLGSLAAVTSPTLAVEGTLAAEGRARLVTGRGWTRRVWGEAPPPGGGAVLFDRLLLDIDGLGLIEAERSKRRSGRGPQITTARLRRGADSEELVAEWNDVAGTGENGAAVATGAVPAAWRLSIESLGIELTLLAPAGGTVSGVAGELAWRGAVRAEGGHEGVGFVEFAPLETPSGNGEVSS